MAMTQTTRKSGTGTVRFFNAQSGRGLVRPDDGSDDIYIQIESDDRARRMDRGRRVSFEIHNPHTSAAWIADLQPL